MMIYNVGSQDAYDLSEINQEQFLWIVYDYEYGDYEGDGEAALLGKDGKLYVIGLGHCSCYGPFENYASQLNEGIVVEDYLKDESSVLSYISRNSVDMRVRELLSQSA